MINRLRGLLVEKSQSHLLVEVNGITYELEVPLSSFYRFPEVGESILIYTHFVVREDAQLLYGFSQSAEQLLFRYLIKVSGVGPKLALAILSALEPDVFGNYILQNDAVSLARIPGVGKKTAERLIMEMRDRLENWHMIGMDKAPNLPITTTDTDKSIQDAISALLSLGYKPQEARRSVLLAAKHHQSSEAILRQALHNMMISTP